MEPLPSTSPRHAVQFYGTEQSLFKTVSEFLGEGLVSNQAAIVIATESHRDGILEALAGRMIDVDRARRGGELVVLDAHELMGTFMVGDEPNPELFEYNVGLVLDQALRVRGANLVRAYGEIVDVLWKEGRSEGAIKLEMLWNKLATRYGFALLCGYSMGNFYKEADRLEEVCRHHSQVIEPGSQVVPFPGRRTASR
jgi:hypothetical protein